jgi:uncharacterized membrane protein YfcA
MQRRKPAGIYPQRWIPEPLQIQIRLAAMAAVALLPLLLLASLLPRPLVLPVLCLIAIAGAAVAAFVAWRRGNAQESSSVTAWDVAGALTFVGCAAAILSNPEQLIHFAENATTLRVSE